jgi:hypothetical protein
LITTGENEIKKSFEKERAMARMAMLKQLQEIDEKERQAGGQVGQDAMEDLLHRRRRQTVKAEVVKTKEDEASEEEFLDPDI